jgi:hypothetical protein
MKQLSRFENFLEEIRIPLRLTAVTPSGWPIVVSLWFQYKGGRLVCATKKSARIVSYLENNPRCAFEIAPDSPPYRGVRGQAIAEIDSSTGKEVLEELLHRYVGDLENSFAQKLLAESENEVAIYLNPRKVFSWDFSNRMKDISPQMLSLSSRFTNV